MAHTMTGVALMEAHQAAQAANLASALQAAKVTFTQVLDMSPARIEATFGPYADIMASIVRNFRQRSHELANEAYLGLRAAEGVTTAAPQLYRQPLPMNDKALRSSLWVTGPGTYQNRVAKGLSHADALSRALTSTLGGMGRHVENAGRHAMMDAVSQDPSAGGWSRASAGNPCSFCAMLISRGPVYKSKKTAMGSRRRRDDADRPKAEETSTGVKYLTDPDRNAMTASMLAAEPWWASREDLLAGNVPGVRIDPNLKAGLAGHRYDRDGTVVFGPSYLSDSPFERFAITSHEAGHDVARSLLAQNDAGELLRDWQEGPDKWNFHNPFGASSKPQELLADAYSEVLMRGTGEYEAGGKYHTLLELASEVGQGLGLPYDRIPGRPLATDAHRY